MLLSLFQLFDHLKELRGVDILNKVHPIAGDVSDPNLAISESDRSLLADTVQIVYHAAATIRFDEALKKAVLLNTRGTKLVLGLAKEMKKLQVRTTLAFSRLLPVGGVHSIWSLGRRIGDAPTLSV